MQMIGDTDLLKDEFFITKKSGDEKYTLVIISEKKKLYFDTILEAQQWCNNHINQT